MAEKEKREKRKRVNGIQPYEDNRFHRFQWARPASFSINNGWDDLLPIYSFTHLLFFSQMYSTSSSHHIYISLTLHTSTYIALYTFLCLCLCLCTLPLLSIHIQDNNAPLLQTLHGLFALTAHCRSSSSWQLFSIQPALTISTCTTTSFQAR